MQDPSNCANSANRPNLLTILLTCKAQENEERTVPCCGVSGCSGKQFKLLRLAKNMLVKTRTNRIPGFILLTVKVTWHERLITPSFSCLHLPNHPGQTSSTKCACLHLASRLTLPLQGSECWSGWAVDVWMLFIPTVIWVLPCWFFLNTPECITCVCSTCKESVHNQLEDLQCLYRIPPGLVGWDLHYSKADCDERVTLLSPKLSTI